MPTTDKNGHPSAQIVLLKDFSDKGLTLLANYESKQGQQLNRNPYAALVYFWPELERQLRFEGTKNSRARNLIHISLPARKEENSCLGINTKQ